MKDEGRTLPSLVLLIAVVALWPRSTGALSSFAVSAKSVNRWLNSQQRTAIDQLFALPADSPGYAVAIIKDGEFAFSRAYGLANLDDDIPITPETSFHLALISNQFTAAAIALRILDHTLTLTDPVAKFIPECAKYGDELRIEHLVYMTSGIHEYTDLPRVGGDPWMTFYVADEPAAEVSTR